MKPVLAVGLMTGTVLDGNIDIPALHARMARRLPSPRKLAPYAAEICPLLASAVAAALPWRFEGEEPAVFREAEDALTRAQSAAVNAFLSEVGLGGKLLRDHRLRPRQRRAGLGAATRPSVRRANSATA